MNIFAAFFVLLVVSQPAVGNTNAAKAAYQHALHTAHLQRKGQCSQQQLLEAVETMQTTALVNPEIQNQADLLAAHCFYSVGEYQRAYPLYLQLLEVSPHTAFYTEALFWAAECAQRCRGVDEANSLRKLLWSQDPSITYAAEAYWRSFTPEEYLSYNAHTINHLKHLEKYFPNSHLQIGCYLLLARGAQAHRQTHTHCYEAIAACMQAETAWLRLSSQQLIPQTLRSTCRTLYQYALLTRSRTCIALALESTSPNKRRLALQQATNLLQELTTTEFRIPALYELAHIYKLQEIPKHAEELLQTLVNENATHPTAYSGTYVDAYSELARYAIERKSFSTALQLLYQAEAIGKKILLPMTQTLDLWLAQSICLHHLSRHNEALRMLSKIVNSPVASSLRIKAMCLRATIYQATGRTALATKQLQSIKRKGGRWKSYAVAELQKMLTLSSDRL